MTVQLDSRSDGDERRSDRKGSSHKWTKCQNVIFLDICNDNLTDKFDIDVMDEVHPTIC